MRQRIVVASLLVLALTQVLRAQAALAADPRDAQWWGGFGLPIRNGAVHSICSYGGLIVVGGPFTQAGTTHARFVAGWDGIGWQALGEGLPGSVEALASYAGQLVAAGVGVPGATGERPMVHTWNGTQWTAIGSLNGTVRALAVYNGELYAGGDFTSVNGVVAAHVARWDGTQWRPAGTGITGQVTFNAPTVRAFALYGTQLIAGGTFSGLQSVAAWDGTSWSALGSGLQLVGIPANVYALGTVGGEVYAGGAIDHSGATSLGNLAKWNGSSWAAVGSNNIQQFAVNQWNGFPQASANSPDPHPAHWTGSAWSIDGSPSISPLAYFNDIASLYCGGNSTASVVDGFLRYDGVSWTPAMQAWAPGMSGMSGDVADLLSFNGALYAAGTLQRAGAEDHWVPITGVGRWDGTAWSALPPSGFNIVYSLGTYGGALVAAGANAVRRLDSGVWSTLGPSADAAIESTVEFGTDLVAVGDFTQFGTTTTNGIARWNGTSWSGLSTGFDPSVDYGIVVASYGGEIVAGGSIASAGGSPAHNLVRWDGTAFHDLGGGVDGQVYALCPFGSALIAGGYFKHAGGIPAVGAARWNGSSWSPFGDNATYIIRIREHAGRLFGAGGFIDGNGQEVDGAAVWTGERWYPLGSGIDGAPEALDFLGDDLYLGGHFAWANGRASFNIARLPNSAAAGVGAGRTPSLALAPSQNPARGPVRLVASLPAAGRTRLAVYDVLGRRVTVLMDEDRAAGDFAVTWDAHVAPGLYFATLEAAGSKVTVRIARLD